MPPGNTSWGVRACASLLGALIPSFAQAADVLARLTPMHVSARALEGYTEDVGAAYTLPVPSPEDPGPVADFVVVETDAGQALFTDGWHEVKIAMAWRRVDGMDQPPCYATMQGPWALHADVVLSLARQAGSRHAQEIVLLGDGDRAHWKLLDACFPTAFALLDWYHLQEHLGKVRIACELDAAWLETQQAALLITGPQTTVRALVALCRCQELTADQRHLARECLHYVWANRHRMAYADARRRGYPIGSGRIESAVKQVLQARAKGAGMRWTHDHLQAVLNARCAFLNGHWDLACVQTQARARSLAPTERPVTPPFRLNIPPWREACPAPISRRTKITVPPGSLPPVKQMANIFRQAFGS